MLLLFFLCHVQHNLDRRPPLGIGMGQTIVFLFLSLLSLD